MGDAFNVVRRFARRREVAEQCEFCSRQITAGHQHLIEPATRKLRCVCDACAVLFSGSHPKYKRVPRSARFLPDFHITDAQWESLSIPIEMAFFYNSSPANRIVAQYPSPAGPTESLLSLETWEDIVRDNPILARLEPDVEALIANRLDSRRREAQESEKQAEYYILPIDECFRLVGLIRLHWKGLSGGTEVWNHISGFFSELRRRAVEQRQVSRA
jgi:uncharacterized protein DUF5947